MNQLEEQVADVMRRRAAATDVPVPDVDQMVHEGEVVLTRRRRRTGLLAAGAAAATVAVVTVGPTLLGLGDDAGGPAHPDPRPTSTPTSLEDRASSLDDLPQGEPPAVPHLYRGALHVDGLAIATSANQVLAAGDTVLVGRSGREDAHWWILLDGALQPVAELDGALGPRLSPRGDLLTWPSYPNAETTRVNAWDPTTQREIDHVDLEAAHTDCCGGGEQIELIGIDDQSAVYWTDWRDRDVHVWRPGTSPTTIPGPADTVPVGSDPPQAAFKGLPAGTQQNGIVQESEHVVLVDAFADPRRHYVLRCDTTDDRCERTLPAGRVSSWTFPTPGW
jgi:hypothetical protein